MNGIHEVTGSIPVRSTILRSPSASSGSVNPRGCVRRRMPRQSRVVSPEREAQRRIAAKAGFVSLPESIVACRRKRRRQDPPSLMESELARTALFHLRRQRFLDIQVIP